jgi:hypothetical protein
MKPFALALVWQLQIDFALTLGIRASSLSIRQGQGADTKEGRGAKADARTAHLNRLLSSSGSTSSGSGPALKRKGNNGSPSSAFPLGMCEGDCDNDSECAGDLVCFQRRANQAVPGCSGGTSDSSPTDYCVESTTLGTTGGVASADFILRLYWEKGAFTGLFAGHDS